jgi:hypothetical protein
MRRTSWALFNSLASLSSSGDFEIGFSLKIDTLSLPQRRRLGRPTTF